MIYRCLVAEDNTLDRDVLQMMLGKIAVLQIVAACANGKEAASLLMNEKIDIVFSDIHMPYLSGIELLKSLITPPVFIFISSFKEFAAESFDLDVVDFIVKPVMQGRLVRAVNKAIEHIEFKKTSVKNLEIKHQPIDETFLFIRTSKGLIKLLTTDITYIKSYGNFSRVFCNDGNFFITLVSLKQLQLQLPESAFIRIHKQYIVNKQKITTIKSSTITIAELYKLPLGPLYRIELLNFVSNENLLER